jgi:oligoribonuclease NrnB/cAMP/cGMP phosphodiesterase (DHH superfamily)
MSRRGRKSDISNVDDVQETKPRPNRRQKIIQPFVDSEKTQPSSDITSTIDTGESQIEVVSTPLTEPRDVDLIIYHRKCMDGKMSFYIARKFLSQFGRINDCSYYEMDYEDKDIPDCTGKNVAIFDFSFKREVVQEIRAKSKSFILLDHHKTALDIVGDEPNCIVDLKESGATLAWKYFFGPDSEIPDVVKIIKNRDTFRWTVKNARLISNYLFNKVNMYDEAEYARLLDNSEFRKDKEKMVNEGALMAQVNNKTVAWASSTAIRVEFAGYITYACQCPILHSDIGAHILLNKPDCSIVIIWANQIYKGETNDDAAKKAPPKGKNEEKKIVQTNEMKMHVHLRSRDTPREPYDPEEPMNDDGLKDMDPIIPQKLDECGSVTPNVDVSKLARIMGGGGHTSAASFWWGDGNSGIFDLLKEANDLFSFWKTI